MPRRLSAEDRALWERVRRSLAPLPRATRAPERSAPPGAPSAPGPGVSQPSPPAPAPFRIGQSARSRGPAEGLIGGVPAAPFAPRMDAKAFRRMTRGRVRPEAKLDLHGMTLDEAEEALRGFVLGAHARGRRLLLVVTGKGHGGGALDVGPMPQRRGALRRQVPVWLARPPLAPVVLEVAQAHATHGGAGALYVYLRR